MTPEMQNATENATEKVDKIPFKTPEAILLCLEEHPQPSLAQIAQRLGKDESTIKRAVKKLQEQKKLLRVGPDKGGYWFSI